MKIPEIDVTATPMVFAPTRNWKDALADEAETDIAVTFHLQLDAGSDAGTRVNLDAWWSAPERALAAGFEAPELPPVWSAFWHTNWGIERKVTRFLPFRRWEPLGQVKVWPGATAFIRSAPKGSELPWLIGVESALSLAVRDDDRGVVMVRQGVGRERAGKALLGGERTLPEQSFTYPAEDEYRRSAEAVFRRSGWMFVIIEEGRVLAVNNLQVEQPGVG